MLVSLIFLYLKCTTQQLVVISYSLYVSQLKLKMPKLEGVKTTFSGENSNQFYNHPTIQLHVVNQTHPIPLELGRKCLLSCFRENV